LQHQVELTMTPLVFNPTHHGQKGTKRTALQALAETVGAEPRACENGGSDTQKVMQTENIMINEFRDKLSLACSALPRPRAGSVLWRQCRQ
jgi:hypothetical protein